MKTWYVVVYVHDCRMTGDAIKTQGGTYMTRAAAEYHARQHCKGRAWYVKPLK